MKRTHFQLELVNSLSYQKLLFCAFLIYVPVFLCDWVHRPYDCAISFSMSLHRPVHTSGRECNMDKIYDIEEEAKSVQGHNYQDISSTGRDT